MCHIQFCTKQFFSIFLLKHIIKEWITSQIYNNLIHFFNWSFNCYQTVRSQNEDSNFRSVIKEAHIFNILRYYNLNPNLLIAPAKPNHAFDWSPKFIIQATTHSRHWLPTPCINNSTVLHLYDIILSTPCIVFSVRYYAN